MYEYDTRDNATIHITYSSLILSERSAPIPLSEPREELASYLLMARDGWMLIGREDIRPRDPPRRVHEEDVLVAGSLSAGRA